MWKAEKQKGGGSAAVTAADGNVYFRYEKGPVVLVEATEGGYKEKGTLTPEVENGSSWAYPVVCDGRLYLRSHEALMCYDVRKK